MKDLYHSPADRRHEFGGTDVGMSPGGALIIADFRMGARS